MVSIQQMQTMLDDIVAELPAEFFERLNGGVVLLPQAMQHEKSVNGDLFVLAQYHAGGGMGRYIAVYYGSMMRVYGRLRGEALKEQLRHTVRHEFRHHIESLAGSKDLELIDEENIGRYLEGKEDE